MTAPHYTKLPQAQLDHVTELVRAFGYHTVIAAICDIVTQDPQAGMELAPELSFHLGLSAGYAEELDRKSVARRA